MLDETVHESPSNLRFALVGAAVSLIIGIVLAPAWWDRPGGAQSAREETLAGNSPTVSLNARPSEPVPATDQGAMDTPEHTVLTFDFNDEPLGYGIGPDWRHTVGGVGAVALVPVPTAVDRSARLESIGGSGAEVCRSLPPLRVTQLVVDFLLEGTAAAGVSTGSTTGHSELHMSLRTSGPAVADATRVLAEGEALDAEEWYRAEVVFDDDRSLWRVTRLAGPPGPVFETAVDPAATDVVGEVCLTVAGEAGDAAHFDNLTFIN